MEERLKKLKALNDLGINPYPYRFDRTHTLKDIKDNFDKLSKDDTDIMCCGRILSIRGHGKTIFITLGDENDRLQIYLRQDQLNARFKQLELLDIGDFLGVRGKVFRTKTDEITVMVNDFVLLSKSLRPLPEKYHGLTDIELRYRRRYLDLIANPIVRDIFKQRAKVLILIRRFFDERGFIEMETPVLQPIYGGGDASPFKTYYHALEQDMYLRIADELYLKRLIVGGFEKVYEICRDFRNEGIDRYHNPEFTMIEVYQAYTDYFGIMEMVEELLEYLIENIGGGSTLEFDNQKVSFGRPFVRLKYVDTLNEKLGYDVLDADDALLDKSCRQYNIDPKELGRGSKIDKLFGEIVQKFLIDPTFVINHPKIISPLAKVNRDDERLVERFELVLFGVELANAFSELNDPLEQRHRFEEQIKLKAEGIKELDEDFIEAIEHGMPPTGGLGIGIDRLCMVLLNQPSIKDVILFPQLRKERH